MSPTSPLKSEKKYIQSVKMIFDLKQKKIWREGHDTVMKWEYNNTFKYRGTWYLADGYGKAIFIELDKERGRGRERGELGRNI